MKVFIGCSSYNDIDRKYFETAKKVVLKCINLKYELVFGCCNNGLMGLVYDEYMKSGLNVYAICTKHYKDDLNTVKCNKVLVNNTYEQIDYFMKSDLYIFLPGGYGTYNEIFYLINSYVTGEHKNNIIIVNTDHYYDELKIILEKIKNEKFAKVFDFVKFIDKIEELDLIL